MILTEAAWGARGLARPSELTGQTGVILTEAATHLLTHCAADGFLALAEKTRVLLVSGAVRPPSSAFAEAVVDLVVVDWPAVARRIVADLSTATLPAANGPFVFGAKSALRVRIGQHAEEFARAS